MTDSSLLSQEYQTVNTALKRLWDAVATHNTAWSWSEPVIRPELTGLILQGVDLSLPTPAETRVTIWSGQREEHFTLGVQNGRAVMSGRGGQFNLDDDSGLPGVISTVGHLTFDTGETLSLGERLAERGFTLSVADHWALIYDDEMRMTPLTARHADGTTLWFTRYESDYGGVTVIRHGEIELGVYVTEEDPDLRSYMEMTDEELERQGLTHLAPSEIVPSSWGVSGDALDYLIRHARAGYPSVLTQGEVPYSVPYDFGMRQSEFACPERTLTRAEALARRQAREQALADAGPPEDVSHEVFRDIRRF